LLLSHAFIAVDELVDGQAEIESVLAVNAKSCLRLWAAGYCLHCRTYCRRTEPDSRHVSKRSGVSDLMAQILRLGAAVVPDAGHGRRGFSASVREIMVN
jgi:hypothetical protein